MGRKRNRVSLICEYCGQTFQVIAARRDSAKYCSKSCRCRAQHRDKRFPIRKGPEHPRWQGPVTVICSYCNCAFQISRGYYNFAKKKGYKHFYCSKDCFKKARSDQYDGSKNPNFKSPPVKLICESCGKSFEMVYWRYNLARKRGQQHWYCSRKCSDPGPVTLTCSQCGRLFQIKRGSYNTGLKRNQKNWFCSDICRSNWQSLNLRAECNPNWRGSTAYEPYGVEFNDALRARVKERDGYCCQICGMAESDCLLQFSRTLDTHHIDYDKSNNDPTNLISLCQSCHATTNGQREHYQRSLAAKVAANLSRRIQTGLEHS